MTALDWHAGGEQRVTLVIKATFRLVHEARMELAAPLPITWEDRLTGPSGSALEAADTAPYVPGADVIVRGHACAPTGQTVRAMSVRLAVFRDRWVLDKTLHVFGDRRGGDSAAAAFQRLPIVFERAFGGPGVDDNPVGVGSAPGDPRLPNIVDPRDGARPASFGPIARAWPARRKLTPREPVIDGASITVPDGFPYRYFRAAPADQQIDQLRGDEWILVEGMHPEIPRLSTRLPSVRGAAMRYRTGGRAEGPIPVEVVADTIAIDMDNLLATILFRGSFSLDEGETTAAFRAFAGVEMPGVPLEWPDLDDLIAPRIIDAPDTTSEEIEELKATTRMTAMRVQDLPLAPRVIGPSVLEPLPVGGALAPERATSRQPDSPVAAAPSRVAPRRAAVSAPVPDPEEATRGISLDELRAQAALRPVIPFAAHGADDEDQTATGPSAAAAFSAVPFLEATPAPPPRRDVAIPGAPWNRPEPAPPPAQDVIDHSAEPGFESETVELSGEALAALVSLPFAGADVHSPHSDAPSHPQGLPPSAPAPVFPFSPSPGSTSTLPFSPSPGSTSTLPFSPPPASTSTLPFSPPPPPAPAPVPPPAGPEPPVWSAPGLAALAPAMLHHEPPPAPAPPAVIAPPPLLIEPPSAPRPAIAAPAELTFPAAPPPPPPPPAKAAPIADDEDGAPPVKAVLAPPDRPTPGAPAPDGAPGVSAPAASSSPATSPARSDGATPPAPSAAASGVRAVVLARLAAREPLAGLDLAGADLRKLDLRRASLSGVSLRGANLSDAKLTEARLEDADLSGADLHDADLSGADLSRADLTRTDLSGARLANATLTGARLHDARGPGAVFDNVSAARATFARGTWDGASFRDADLAACDFSGASLSTADLSGARLPAARLEDARAHAALFDGAILADVEAPGAELTACSLRDVDAPRSTWTRAILRESRLCGAVLTAANLERANLTKADLTSAHLPRANLQRVTGDFANFTRAVLEGADLRNAHLVSATFEEANLRDISAARADLSRATFTGANLTNAQLRFARLRESNLTRAALEGADLRDADLERTDLRGSTRSGAKLSGANLRDAVE